MPPEDSIFVAYRSQIDALIPAKKKREKGGEAGR
jgi:hypothetical protein